MNQFISKFQNRDLGLLLVRIAIAASFIAHGWMKFQNIDGVVGFFGTLGLPAFVAYAVATIELVGGIAVLAGVFTRISGVLIAAVMVGALCTAKAGLPFLNGQNGGTEYEWVLLLVALGIAFAGAGRYSLSSLFKRG